MRRALPGFGHTDPARGARFPLDGSDAQPRRLDRTQGEAREALRSSGSLFLSLSFSKADLQRG